jgi:hypothetical protein
MSSVAPITQEVLPPPPRFRFLPAARYFLLAFLLPICLTWPIAKVAQNWAPWLVFPLLVGGLVGVIGLKAAMHLNVGHRATIYGVTGLAACAVAIWLHYFQYLYASDPKSSSELEMFRNAFPEMGYSGRPTHFLEFLNRMARAGRPLPFGMIARDGWAWASWGLDALLIIGGAMGVIRFGTHPPFCAKCQSYFRITRRESLREEQVARLSEMFSWGLSPGDIAEYEHFTCKGQCHEDLAQFFIRPKLGRGMIRRELWFDRAERALVFQVLDQSE